MKQWQIIMGMPVAVEIRDASAKEALFSAVFDYFRSVDARFSTFKPESEISRINRGLIKPRAYSGDMKTIFSLAERTERETGGYFSIRRPAGGYDPSGVVKGWAIGRAAELLVRAGMENFYVEAGGDIQVRGTGKGGGWRTGIRNPFNTREIVKTVCLARNEGIATSGTYERGNHVYNPRDPADPLDEIVSITVIGENICEADRFATAAFAMQRAGIEFLERLPGVEGYMIDRDGVATMTSGFGRYVR